MAISLPITQFNSISSFQKEPLQETAAKDSFISRVAQRTLQSLIDALRIDRRLSAFYTTPSKSNATELGWDALRIIVIGSSIYAFGALFTLGHILTALTVSHAIQEYAKDCPFHSFSDYFPSNTALAHIALGVASFLITGPATALLLTGIMQIMESQGISFTAQQDVDKLIQQPGIPGLLWSLYAAIGAPILEEWLFRGLLQDGFSTVPSMQNSTGPNKKPDNQMSWEKMSAILKASTIFGLCHATPQQGWFNIPIVAATTFMGICKGILKETTGDLWAPTALHATNNTLAVLSRRLST
jgi:membrane protease YdiL (CAAX protease family)